MGIFKRGSLEPTAPTKSKDDIQGDLYESAVKEDLGKTESGANRGPFVDMLNSQSNVELGSPWCASFASYRIRKTAVKWGTKVQIFLSPAVMEMARLNRNKIHQDPKEGDICLMQHGGGSTGHCGIVGPVNKDGSHFSIEGNTSSSDPGERNGGMVAIHTRKPGGIYGSLKVIGYISPFG